MTKYFLNQTPTSIMVIKELVDGTIIWVPCDEANTDYQAYLAWVAEGNTAEEWSPDDAS